MAALKSIKSQIRATGRINKVTKAMEAVSAVKMRKSQDMAIAGRAYAAAAVAVLARLAKSEHAREHPLFQTQSGAKTLILVITSDKGLAGSLNASVLKKVEEYIALHCPDRSLVDVYTVGRKGNMHFKTRASNNIGYMENKNDDVAISDVRDVADILTERYFSGEYSNCLVAYSSFKSTFEQKAVVHTLLPLQLDTLQEVVNDIVPEEGKYSDMEAREVALYTVEPNPEEVLDILVPKLLAVSIYHMLLESKASEHSARMVAMKNATDKSGERIDDLTLEFNRARQAVITQEVSEIIGGIEAIA